MKVVKVIKYSFVSLLAGLIVILITGSLFTYFYKDTIIRYFVTRANERLEVPVKVDKIDVSFLKNFPNISIVLQDVSIQSGQNFKSPYLANIKSAQFTLNPLKIIKGIYEIEDFILENGELFLEINDSGETNYQILKKSGDENKDIEGTIQFILNEVSINFLDFKSNKIVSFRAEKANSKIKYVDKKYNTTVRGNFLINHITIDELDYFKNKRAAITSILLVDERNKFITIENSNIKLENGEFEIKGDIAYEDNTKVDLTIQGINTKAQTLVSILPDKYSDYLSGYKSKGEIYFSGTVSGQFTENLFPNTKLSFGAKNASFFHPDYAKSFEEIFLTGEFETGRNRNLTHAKLNLKDVSFLLDNRRIKGELEVTNFRDPFIKSEVVGKVNLNSLIKSFPKSNIIDAYGEVDLNVTFSGKPRSGKSVNNFNANGEVVLNDVSFILEGERLPFNHFKGSFIFRKNDLAISDFSGEVGKSDFLINGFFRNLSGFIDKEGKTIKIEADLSSNHLDFNELLKTNFASRDTVQNGGSKYSFNISPDIDLNFNCDVKSLKLKRFSGKNISGNLRVINKIAILNNVELSTMGGNIKLSGSVNNRINNIVEILCEANLGKIYIDSIFYVFNNFDQNWLMDKNLKGQLNADVNTYILLDNHLKFYSKDFKADINASILNGELLEFEPMQKLSKFVEEKSLAHLRFSEMRNNIKIENRTIYIPEMIISSSISSIQISGTHTFDQQIDYHFAVPLKNFLRLGKLSNREIEESTTGTHLLLKIQGTTDDYTIKYDTKALKKKLSEDIKGEGEELKQIIKNKGKDENEVIKVEEDDYFDF